MGMDRSTKWLTSAALSLLAACVWSSTVATSFAQFGPFWFPSGGPSFDVSDSVTVDEIGSSGKKQFEQSRAFLANSQWAEAIDILRRVAETHGEKVVAVDDHVYLSVRDYCQLQYAELPAAGLMIYRQLVDPQAKKWYEQGIASRDQASLELVLSQAFCSSWGDDALLALGEFQLEQGNISLARDYWDRLIPSASRPQGRLTRLVYPDTDIAPAEIRARLVLASILEGSRALARHELQRFGDVLSSHQGRLAGKHGNYAELLGQMIDSVTPLVAVDSDLTWPSFAGSTRRQHPIGGTIDIAAVRWKQSLPLSPPVEYKTGPRRVAEQPKEPLSYHPIVVDDLAVVLTKVQEKATDPNRLIQQLHVFNLRSGEPAWGDGPLELDIGPRVSSAQSAALGVARFTLTAHGQRLYVRVGNPNTTIPSSDQPFPKTPGSLMCLDLTQQGKVLWDLSPGEEKWSFEGAPVCDGTNLYIGMRRSDVRPQAHVACFDAQTRQMRWRRFISAAETPGQGQMEEVTHNLLTLDGDRLYYNTNLGTVAALDTHDGHVQWIHRYQRARGDSSYEPHLHFTRDLTPCIVDRGRLFVAPSDTSRILALDAYSGELLWETGLANNVVHLLGVVNGKLVASGDKLWFIQVDPVETRREPRIEDRFIGGKVLADWPPADKQCGSFGRGVIVGNEVYFPTHDALQVFDTLPDRPVHQRTIELTETRGAHGGNLTVAAGHLLITNHREILAFEQVAGSGR